MTPDEEIQVRRDAQVRRSHRIDALDSGQLANFIHRLAAIVPGDIDRVLGEFDANAPRPRAEKQPHPVQFYGADPESYDPPTAGIIAYCKLDPLWHVRLEDGHSLADLERLVREHSGIEP